MSASTLALAALCLIAGFALADADKLYRGEGTAYSGYKEKDATGFNSCGFGKLDDRWERYYAARPSKVFDRESDCGRCIRARGTEKGASGEWVTVMIVDECAGCPGKGDIDFSTDALKAITGYSWDRKGIEWEWTDCDSGDSKDSGKDGEEEDSKSDKEDKEGSKDEEDGKDEKDDDSKDEEDSKGNRRLLRA